MKTHVGLWIDHQKAVVVLPSETGEEIKEILSHANIREPHQDLAEDAKDRKFGQQLNTYYDEVIACIHDAGSLLVMGPGEAKGEFTTRLAHEKGADRTVKMETADKMTNRQIAARVREYFKKESPVILL